MRRSGAGFAAGLACAALLLASCASATGQAATPTERETAADLLPRALDARTAGDLDGFAALVSRARDACADPDASARLGEVALVAERWVLAVQAGRPKQQAVTEALLDEVDWVALATDCAA